MSKKILTALLLSLSVMCFSGIAYGPDEAINECNEQLMQKYPNVETIKEQFGNEAKWQQETLVSPHDSTVELLLRHMEYPGIEIRTLEMEDGYFVVSVGVEKTGFVDFLGIDIGSAKEDVTKKFGEPQQVEGNEHIYHNESEYTFITFTLENNKVVGMQLVNYLD